MKTKLSYANDPEFERVKDKDNELKEDTITLIKI